MLVFAGIGRRWPNIETASGECLVFDGIGLLGSTEISLLKGEEDPVVTRPRPFEPL